VAAKSSKTQIDSKTEKPLLGHKSRKVKHWNKVTTVDQLKTDLVPFQHSRRRHVQRRQRELNGEKYARRGARHMAKGIEDWGAPNFRKTSRGRTPSENRRANPPRVTARSNGKRVEAVIVDKPTSSALSTSSQEARKQIVLDRLNALASQHDKKHPPTTEDFEMVDGKMGSGEVSEPRSERANPYRDAHTALSAHANTTTHAAPVTMGKVFTQEAPHVSYSGDGTVRIRHTELIDSVVALPMATVDDMTIHSYAINPGLPTYKWLNRIARGFHIWEMGRPWHAKYISRVGTSSVGGVIMAHQPDVEAPLPSSEQEITTLTGSKEFQPWLPEVSIRIEPLEAPAGLKYVRSERKAGAPQLYDEGQLFVASLGVGVTPPVTELLLGKLFMSYDVILSFPNGDPDARDYGATSTTVSVYPSTPGIPVQPDFLEFGFATFPILGDEASFRPNGVNPLQVTLTPAVGVGAFMSLPTGYYSFDLSYLAVVTGTTASEAVYACFYDTKSAAYLGETSVDHIIHSEKVQQCRLHTSFWVDDSMLLAVHYSTVSTAGQLKGSGYAPAGLFSPVCCQVRVTLL
jgi:hypothetical protein